MKEESKEISLANVVYIGLFTSDKGREDLHGLAVDSDLEVGGNDINTLLILSDEYGTREYCHHATLAFHTQVNHPDFGRVAEFYKANKGKWFKATATHIGVNPSATAVAVKVDLGDIPCCNENPHITLLTCRGGKPMQSNEIAEWQPLPKPLSLALRCDALEKK